MDDNSMQNVSDYEKLIPVNFSCKNLTTISMEKGDLMIHWSTQLIFKSLYSIIISTSIISNLLIIYVVSSTKYLHTVRNLFIGSQAVSDLLMSTTSGILTPTYILMNYWAFGKLMCKFTGFIQGMSFFITAYNLVCIAIDRYILIVKAQIWQPINARHATIMIGCIWCLAAVAALPPVIALTVDKYGGVCDQPEVCGEHWPENDRYIRTLYGIGNPIWQFFIPLSIIAYCYVMAIKRINKTAQFRRHSAPPIPASAKEPNNNKKCTDSQKADEINVLLLPCTANESNQLGTTSENGVPTTEGRRGSVLPQCARANNSADYNRMQRTNMILATIVLTFALFCMPHMVNIILQDMNWVPKFMDEQAPLTAMICHCLMMVTTVTNPILYGYFNKNVNDAIRELYRNHRNKIRNLLRHEKPMKQPVFEFHAADQQE